MAITSYAAMWFLPFVLPICFYVAFTDMRAMRITNQAVLALAAVYVVIGPVALQLLSSDWVSMTILTIPFALPPYAWGLITMVFVLIVTFFLNAIGAMGAGDSKFIAAASPFIAAGDLRLVVALLAACLLAAHATHRLVKHTRLRTVAPHWDSWDRGKKFPMGLVLSGTLAMYLVLGVWQGA